ncbi:MAG: hypothetical protein RLZZ501_2535 [Pseudomonadota bacterium]|jgi:3-oxoacyl-[acyl-carrier-protein] synthase-1
MTAPLYLSDLALASCLGLDRASHLAALFADAPPGRFTPWPGGRTLVGALPAPLPPLPAALAGFDCRNNRLLWQLAGQIRPAVTAAAARFGPDRVAVVIGTSTGGIAEGESALAAHLAEGCWPAGFHYRQQELAGGAEMLARGLGLAGPALAVATACSSGAKAFAAARRLIRLGLADAALVGGADTLCAMTIAGFSALEAVAAGPCRPFSRDRDGITIGEGGALFLVGPDPAPVALLGIGESSDAHHVSAPDPSGRGAALAMRRALDDAGLAPAAIGYLNLHGTATRLNDAMEGRAVATLFEPPPPCGSTKGLTGHTLGAAGAIEAGLAWLTLHPDWNPGRLLPLHRWDGAADPDIPPLDLVGPGRTLAAGTAVMSSSFAFGGSNCALILGEGE